MTKKKSKGFRGTPKQHIKENGDKRKPSDRVPLAGLDLNAPRPKSDKIEEPDLARVTKAKKKKGFRGTPKQNIKGNGNKRERSDRVPLAELDFNTPRPKRDKTDEPDLARVTKNVASSSEKKDENPKYLLEFVKNFEDFSSFRRLDLYPKECCLDIHLKDVENMSFRYWVRESKLVLYSKKEETKVYSFINDMKEIKSEITALVKEYTPCERIDAKRVSIETLKNHSDEKFEDPLDVWKSKDITICPALLIRPSNCDKIVKTAEVNGKGRHTGRCQPCSDLVKSKNLLRKNRLNMDIRSYPQRMKNGERRAREERENFIEISDEAQNCALAKQMASMRPPNPSEYGFTFYHLWQDSIRAQEERIKQGKGMQNFSWHPAVFSFCMDTLNYGGLRAYSALRRAHPYLPSPQYLMKKRNQEPMEPGITPTNMKAFNRRFTAACEKSDCDREAKGLKKLGENQKHMGLVLFDEMSTKYGVIYGQYSKQIEGFETLGANLDRRKKALIFQSLDCDSTVTLKHMGASVNLLSDEEKAQRIKDLQTAKKATETRGTGLFLFYYRSLTLRFHHPIGAFHCSNAKTNSILKMLMESLEAMAELNMRVICVAPDGASGHRKLMYLLCGNKTYFIHPITGDKVFFFMEYVHLLKRIRNALYNRTLKFGETLVNWKLIADVVAYNETLPCSESYKLTTKKHIQLTSWSKMNVRLAAQIISTSFSCTLRSYQSIWNHKYPENMLNLECLCDFISLGNGFFDVYNDSYPYYDSKDPRLKKLDKFLDFLENWKKELGEENKQHFIPNDLLDDLRQTINGTKQMIDTYVDIDNGLLFIILKHINQDYVENLFSRIRQECGGERDPSFKKALRALQKLIKKHFDKVGPGFGATCEPLPGSNGFFPEGVERMASKHQDFTAPLVDEIIGSEVY